MNDDDNNAPSASMSLWVRVGVVLAVEAAALALVWVLGERMGHPEWISTAAVFVPIIGVAAILLWPDRRR